MRLLEGGPVTELGSGICHCGMDMEDHTGWENHQAIEMMYEKKKKEEK